MVDGESIGFVLAGQKVSVKLDAFPFTRYGTIHGEVVDVSRDSDKDDKLCLIYPVKCDSTQPTSLSMASTAIAPGMAVSAEIITGDRWVIEYVLSPVLCYRSEAGRER